MLKLEGLKFGYTIACCKEPINIDIYKGSFFSITGANGVGKSTLIKTILGDTPMLNGNVFLNGKDTKSIDLFEKAKLISIVSSKFNTSLNLTVKDILNHADIVNQKNVFFTTNHSFELKILTVLSDLGVSDLIDSQFNRLSSGQQQLILIARAILQNTSIIILDEPTAFLDVKNKLLIFNLLKKLSTDGKLIILISHDIDLVYKYSNSILFLGKEINEIVDKKNISLDDFYQKFSV